MRYVILQIRGRGEPAKMKLGKNVNQVKLDEFFFFLVCSGVPEKRPLWPIGFRQPFKPQSRFEVLQWEYFTDTSSYGFTEVNPKVNLVNCKILYFLCIFSRKFWLVDEKTYATFSPNLIEKVIWTRALWRLMTQVFHCVCCRGFFWLKVAMVSHVIKNRFKPPPLLSKGTFAGGLQERRRGRQRNGHQNVDTRIL